MNDEIREGSGQDDYGAYTGNGFGTRVAKIPARDRTPPTVTSTRGYMRGALPAIYQEDDFSMRFVSGFERTFDPIMAVLDSLPAHIDPNFAPPDILSLLATWLGVTLDEAQPVERHRLAVKNASELWRRRGTMPGLILALKLSFPELTFRVDDPGGAEWANTDQPATPLETGSNFDVYCEESINKRTESNIVRRIDEFKPVHMRFQFHAKVEESTDDQ